MRGCEAVGAGLIGGVEDELRGSEGEEVIGRVEDGEETSEGALAGAVLAEEVEGGKRGSGGSGWRYLSWGWARFGESSVRDRFLTGADRRRVV